MNNFKKSLHVFRRLIYILLPVILLFIIFRRIELTQLINNLKNANPYVVCMGIVLKPLLIILGATRWRQINNFYCHKKLPAGYMLYHYWAGLAIGYFTPGNLGWDAYRVMVIGRKLKTFTSAFITVVAEKFIGLFSVFTMALFMFPIISDKIVYNGAILKNIYLIVVTGLLVVLFVFVVFLKLIRKMDYSKIKIFGEKFISKFFDTIKNKEIIEKIKKDYKKSINIFSIIRNPRVFTFSFLMSLGILFISAICSQIIFKGFDYEISFLVNLFTAPVFFLLFIIPISFGSIGVREGAYILVYKLFGVPMEIALLVSFFNLFGLILNNIIGALVILSKGVLSGNLRDLPVDK